MKQLRGIAWNHTRGFVSVVATAQRFEELHPGVSITWEKRSLQAFADASMAELAANFDLIIMDHPHTALAATEGLLLPYEDWLSAEFLQNQSENSVGASHASYGYDGRQWTLATDAAAPIATWRADLLEKHKLNLPHKWDQVLALAKAGYVTVSAFPIDVLMHSYMFCRAMGHPDFSSEEEIDAATLTAALEELRKLVSHCDPACLERNPIRTAEWMASVKDDQRATYCPFAYGYSNYSRPGYARHILKAGGLVQFGAGNLRSTLGGAGVAVSAKTQHPRECMDYAAFTAEPATQAGIYFEAGGQPGHRAAWTSKALNIASSNFFQDTLETLDEAILRPRHPGGMAFQDAATPLAHDAVAGRMKVADAARQICDLYSKSIPHYV